MMPRDRKDTRRMTGFTLLELMVALVMLGLISTLALGGVRLGARTWETVTAKAEGNGRTQMVRAFLARELAQAAPLHVPDSGSATRLAYEGERDSLVFIAPLAPHFGLGGLQRLELSITDGGFDAGKQLILTRRRFYRDDRLDTADEEDEIHVLLDGIAEAGFAYRESGRDGDPGWSGDWRDRDELPALVRLRVAFVDGRAAIWPDLLVARRITTKPGCLPTGTGAACRGR